MDHFSFGFKPALGFFNGLLAGSGVFGCPGLELLGQGLLGGFLLFGCRGELVFLLCSLGLGAGSLLELGVVVLLPGLSTGLGLLELLLRTLSLLIGCLEAVLVTLQFGLASRLLSVLLLHSHVHLAECVIKTVGVACHALHSRPDIAGEHGGIMNETLENVQWHANGGHTSSAVGVLPDSAAGLLLFLLLGLVGLLAAGNGLLMCLGCGDGILSALNCLLSGALVGLMLRLLLSHLVFDLFCPRAIVQNVQNFILNLLDLSRRAGRRRIIWVDLFHTWAEGLVLSGARRRRLFFWPARLFPAPAGCRDERFGARRRSRRQGGRAGRSACRRSG